MILPAYSRLEGRCRAWLFKNGMRLGLALLATQQRQFQAGCELLRFSNAAGAIPKASTRDSLTTPLLDRLWNLIRSSSTSVSSVSNAQRVERHQMRVHETRADQKYGSAPLSSSHPPMIGLKGSQTKPVSPPLLRSSACWQRRLGWKKAGR